MVGRKALPRGPGRGGGGGALEGRASRGSQHEGWAAKQPCLQMSILRAKAFFFWKKGCPFWRSSLHISGCDGQQVHYGLREAGMAGPGAERAYISGEGRGQPQHNPASRASTRCQPFS
jgi:hypothetical protein